MPLKQDIEKGHRVSYSAFEVVPNTMIHMLEMTNDCQYRQDRFNHHAVIPGSFGTNLQIGWVPVYFLKMEVSEDQYRILPTN